MVILVLWIHTFCLLPRGLWWGKASWAAGLERRLGRCRGRHLGVGCGLGSSWESYCAFALDLGRDHSPGCCKIPFLELMLMMKCQFIEVAEQRNHLSEEPDGHPPAPGPVCP